MLLKRLARMLQGADALKITIEVGDHFLLVSFQFHGSEAADVARYFFEDDVVLDQVVLCKQAVVGIDHVVPSRGLDLT